MNLVLSWNNNPSNRSKSLMAWTMLSTGYLSSWWGAKLELKWWTYRDTIIGHTPSKNFILCTVRICTTVPTELLDRFALKCVLLISPTILTRIVDSILFDHWICYFRIIFFGCRVPWESFTDLFFQSDIFELDLTLNFRISSDAPIEIGPGRGILNLKEKGFILDYADYTSRRSLRSLSHRLQRVKTSCKLFQSNTLHKL